MCLSSKKPGGLGWQDYIVIFVPITTDVDAPEEVIVHFQILGLQAGKPKPVTSEQHNCPFMFQNRVVAQIHYIREDTIKIPLLFVMIA